MTTKVNSLSGSDSESTAPARRTSEELMRRVEQQLYSFLSAEREAWVKVDKRAVVGIEALSRLVASGGKRIRPAFCISGYLAAGGDPEDPGVVLAASALEMLHVSALIHDDVFDASSQRRGIPTVHVQHAALHAAHAWQGESRRYGESVAVLIGNLALVYSDQLMSRAPSTVDRVWNKLRSEVMIGQYMDVAAAAEFSIDPELSRLIALVKSGHYTIHRPLAVGASVAGRSDLAPAFKEYGEAVGEAFQLRDDLLDAFGDAAETGKPAGLDFSQHKMTLLLGWAMQRDERIRMLIEEPGHGADEVRQRLVDTGVPADVEERITGLVERACRAIEQSPIDPVWRNELMKMAVRVAWRSA